MSNKGSGGGARLPRICFAMALLLGSLWFIWSNSLLSAQESGLRSQAVAEFLSSALGYILGPQNRIVRFLYENVRKVAHAVEFFVLGMVAVAALAALGRVNIHTTLHATLLVLCAAVADETIQIYTGRGAQVQDILLDFAGGMAGLFCALALYSVLCVLLRKIRDT